MARALTSDELTAIRSDGQICRLYLAVHVPTTVFTARVNGKPASNDRVAQITYDGGSAGWISAIPGQTVLVGTKAGASDLGIVRLRDDLPGVSGTMKIGETSAITWQDDAYLTVLDEFSLWPRHLRMTEDGTVYMDYDIAYVDQHEDRHPVPVLGPAATVVWLTGATVSVQFDASDSWIPDAAITGYDWVAPGASATSGMSTATPTITYNAAGVYRVSCSVVADNDKGAIGYRYVFVYDEDHPPTTAFQLESCSGSWDTGGWSFTVTLWDEATLAAIRSRAMVVLFARDFYEDVEASIGPVAGRENVVALGWIADENVAWNPEQGNVRFTVQGPHWWFGHMTGFPVGIEDVSGSPVAWTEFEDLTIDKGVWHMLRWRTTATLIMDVRVSGDTRQISTFEAPVGSLWDQMLESSEKAILARPCSDRYGRLYFEVDTQYLPSAERAAIPVVMELTKQDWADELVLERQIAPQIGMVDLSGVAYSDGTGTPLFALSPGHVFANYGGVYTREFMALADQAQANELAGLILGQLCNEYPTVSASLAGNNRAFDICPRQFATLEVEAGDTERGIAWTKHLIPRHVSLQHDAEAGVLLPSIEFEAETFAFDAIIGDPPPEPPPPPPAPPLPPDPWIPPLPEIPDVEIVFASAIGQLGMTLDWRETNPVWVDISTGLPSGFTVYEIDVGLDGQAWAVVRHSNYASSGLYYCANILETPFVAWSLVLDCETAYGMTTTKNRQRFESLAVDAESECWVYMEDRGYPSDRTGFWHGNPVTLPGSYQIIPADPYPKQANRGAPTGLPVLSPPGDIVYPQNTMWYNAANDCVYAGVGALLNRRIVFNLSTKTEIRATSGARYAHSIEGGYCLGSAYTGSGGSELFNFLTNINVVLWTNNHTEGMPLRVGPDGGILTAEYEPSGRYLLFNGARIDTSRVDDVFSGSNLSRGIFDFGHTDDEILYACNTAREGGNIGIAASHNRGLTWRSLMGNWVATFGQWAGGSAGGGLPHAFIKYCFIPGGSG